MRYLAIALLFCALPTNAQIRADIEPAKIEAPKRKPTPERVADKKFFATVAILGAAKAADGFASAGIPKGCRELNPILGAHPSDGRFAGYFTVTYALEIGAAYAVKRYGQHHRWARHLWLIEPGRQIPLHIYWAAHNSRLSCP